MAVNFPSGYHLDWASPVRHKSRVKVRRWSDGTPYSQRTTTTRWIEFDCQISGMTVALRTALINFIYDNDEEPAVLWTIDGVNYSGRFVGDITEGMAGRNNTSLRFRYYAKAV